MTHSIPEGFKRRLLAELTSQIPAQPARASAGWQAAGRDPTMGTGPRPRGRQLLAGAAGIVAAGIVATAVLTGQAGPAPTTGPIALHIVTAAWTVDVKGDRVVVTVRELKHPARLQAALREAGVNAVVLFGYSQHDPRWRCGLPVGTKALTLAYGQYQKGWVVVIHRQFLSKGDVVNIGIIGPDNRRHRSGQDVANVCHIRG